VVAAVVGKVGLAAVVAPVEAAAELGGAARQDAAHGPVVGGAKMLPVNPGVVGPVFTEQLCKVESHESIRGC
jgi:hypothetical protein